jgi:peptidoglycan/LPS O-acetylase OafA/YrhL
MHYRADVDGLRALAVIPVVLYHMGFPTFSGGFVGVDVFFVISGYLITSIIVRDLEDPLRRFSLRTFYERRIRRIFPALYFMLAVTTALAYVVLLPRDLTDYAKSLVATAVFASNIFFYRQWGYFDAEAHTKPLLHTWSLAVEEQFYVVFPILLVILYRTLKTRVRVRGVLSFLAFASFVWALLLVRDQPAAAFYLAPVRAWELLLGALLALGAAPALRPNAANAAALIGAVLLAVPVLLYTEATPFPGPTALVPCVGAALLIHAGPSTIVNRLLALRPVVFVGLISYSLYLWHWTLLSIARHWALGPLSVAQTWGVVGVSVACAAFSWRFVERPWRVAMPAATAPALPRGWWRIFAWGAAVSSIAIMLGVLGWQAKGWVTRVPRAAMAFDNQRDDFNPRRPECHANDGMPIAYERTCRFGATDRATRYAIWGDSHAAELIIALGDLAARAGSSMRMITYSACPPGSVGAGAAAGTGGCALHQVRMQRALIADTTVRVVFLVARYGYARDAQGDSYFVELGRVARALADARKRVVLIYPSPEYAVPVPVQLARAVHRGTPVEDVGMSRAAFEAQRAPVVRALDAIRTDPRIEKVDPAARLCDETRCRVASGGHALYFDDDHLSVEGARFVAPEFQGWFPQARTNVAPSRRRGTSRAVAAPPARPRTDR